MWGFGNWGKRRKGEGEDGKKDDESYSALPHLSVFLLLSPFPFLPPQPHLSPTSFFFPLGVQLTVGEFFDRKKERDGKRKEWTEDEKRMEERKGEDEETEE